ncbi:MAG: hypothetical protein GY822_07580 [Deltaproteobacteria bacterium]|nr:hypothetical protein [Deltaproteobacteria bacterium]
MASTTTATAFFLDCADYSCSQPEPENAELVGSACSESAAFGSVTPDDNCTDGLDNDRDGFVDCDDWDCAYNPAVTVCASHNICRSAF